MWMRSSSFYGRMGSYYLDDRKEVDKVWRSWSILACTDLDDWDCFESMVNLIIGLSSKEWLNWW
jgi:hypothetical protein